MDNVAQIRKLRRVALLYLLSHSWKRQLLGLGQDRAANKSNFVLTKIVCDVNAVSSTVDDYSCTQCAVQSTIDCSFMLSLAPSKITQQPTDTCMFM